MINMLKKIFTFISAAVLSMSFMQTAFADIMLNVTTDEPYRSAKEYSDYVIKRLNGKVFRADVPGDVPSTVQTTFNGNKVSIVCKNNEKTNYYEGIFTIVGNSSNLEITKFYSSDKFGFYSVKDYSEDPVRVENFVKIYDDKLELTLRSSKFPEINSNTDNTGNSTLGIPTADEKNLFKTVKGEQAAIFLTSKDWVIVNENPKTDFNRIQFAPNRVAYLINDKTHDKIKITECYYEISGEFKLTPVKSYEIDKINKTYTINDLSGSDALNYAVDYIDSTNSYYLTAGNYTYKIIPGSFEAFKLNSSLATKQAISKEILTKTVKLAESNARFANLNFYGDLTFDGVFVNKTEEYNVSGKYALSDGIVNLEFKQTDYFIGNEYYKDLSGKKYTAKINFSYKDENLFGAFESENYSEFGSTAKSLKYLAVGNGNEFVKKRIPSDVSGADLSLLIKEKAFSFKKGNIDYKIAFKPNNLVELSIMRNNVLETIKGSYNIEGNQIKIAVNNDKYNYGYYANFELGNIIKQNSDIFMTIILSAKYDNVNKELYFNIYDGSQADNKNRVDNYSYINNEMPSAAFCKTFLLTENEEVIPTLKALTIDELKKSFVNAKFSLQYLDSSKALYNEAYYLDKNGKIYINSVDGSNKRLIIGTYTLANNRVNISFNQDYSYKGKLVDNSTTAQNKISFDIFKDNENFYLKLADGIYLKAKMGQGTVVTDPKKLS